jgi:hypothetical protein
MPDRFRFFLTVFAAGALSAQCSPSPGDAKPVAIPTVRLSTDQAAVGSPLDINYRFAVAPDAPTLSNEYVVFVHFMDPTGERLWTDDHEPPTPAGRWKGGETIEYERTVFVPKLEYTGRAEVQLGLYLPTTGERLPLGGEDTGMRAYRVAQFEVTAPSESVFVVFKDGWHDGEVSEDRGLEWQWSRREGTVSFRNPKRDAQLLLQVDQPVQALGEPQQVTIRLGGSDLDKFALAPGAAVLRRVDLPASLLGSAETVEVTIAVDRTFVPADVPALRSPDARELGIRVFRVYVEPK